MSPSTRLTSLSAWRRIPGPPRDRVKARLLRLHVAMLRRFGPQRRPRGRTPPEVAAAVIRSTGTERLAARRVRRFTSWLRERFGGRFDGMRRAPLGPLRAEMLKIPGLGPETVDAILLHAAGRPVALGDAATRRVLAHHRLLPASATYEQARALLEAHLPSDPALFNEFHALMVVSSRALRAGPRSARPRRAPRAPSRARPSS